MYNGCSPPLVVLTFVLIVLIVLIVRIVLIVGVSVLGNTVEALMMCLAVVTVCVVLHNQSVSDQ